MLLEGAIVDSVQLRNESAGTKFSRMYCRSIPLLEPNSLEVVVTGRSTSSTSLSMTPPRKVVYPLHFAFSFPFEGDGVVRGIDRDNPHGLLSGRSQFPRNWNRNLPGLAGVEFTRGRSPKERVDGNAARVSRDSTVAVPAEGAPPILHRAFSRACR